LTWKTRFCRKNRAPRFGPGGEFYAGARRREAAEIHAARVADLRAVLGQPALRPRAAEVAQALEEGQVGDQLGLGRQRAQVVVRR
jgi:hypothetical protein